jgi:ABC-type polysaccharide/polyol phosphate export permease
MLEHINEILNHRSLIRELVVKDLKVRYARSILGYFWAFLSPLLLVAIFYLVFAVILRAQVREAPYVLYLMSAIFIWRFLQDSVVCSASSLVDNRNLIKEANFPQHLIPLSIVLANAVLFLPSLGILIVMAWLSQQGLPFFVVFLPVILALYFIIALSLALFAAVIYTRFHDLKYMLDLVLQLLFYLMPAVYSLSLIKEGLHPFWASLYVLNPFVGLLNLYRLTVFKDFYPFVSETGLASLLLVPFCFAAVVCTGSIYYYRKHKNTINDYLYC